MTKREKHLLWMILNKTIGRYILVNMPGYGSGERADLHLIYKQNIVSLHTYGWRLVDYQRLRG